MYVHYLDHLEHRTISNAKFVLDDLPLVAPAPGSKKSFKEFFQIVRNISLADQQAIHAAMSQAAASKSAPRFPDLPPCVRPGDSLGDSCSLQIALHYGDDGSCSALKFYHSKVNIPLGLAKTLCDEQVLVINYGIAKNSDSVKKAFLHMLSDVKGEQWLCQVLRSKQIRPPRAEGDLDRSWNPTEEELRTGIGYINEHAPLSNSKNEQYLWVLLNIRDNESPLFGWPQHIVLKACANRTTGNCQAEPEYFFPLLIFDLNETFIKEIVTLIVPLMPSFGLMILGRAGIGKTPTAQILAMAVARHMTTSRNMAGLPGWRRSKQIDGFRERPGEVNVPVLLDDPNLSGINLEDLKSFLDVGENCLVDARYRAAKFVRNQCRIVLSNEWDDSKEPEDTLLDKISWDQFKGMFLTACQYPKVPHLMAILKRTVVIIAGFKGVYVRLPSEHATEPIRRFGGDGITEDWLEKTHKEYYGLYKQGLHEKYDGYEAKLEEEQALVAQLLATPEEKTYMQRAETHDKWRLEAGDMGTPAPSTPPSNIGPLAPPPISSPLRLKEEITSPPQKKLRFFGVIDVEAEPSQSDFAEVEEMEANEEDVFGHGGDLR